MKHTVIAVFDTPAQAQKAADSLTGHGFGSAAVHVGAPSAGAADPHANEPLPAAVAIEGGPGTGLMHRLSVLFGVDDEPHIGHYTEAVRRGSSVVQVEAVDETQAATARDALLALGAVNIDDRVDTWRQAGWDGDGSDADAPASAATAARTVEQAGLEGAAPEGGRLAGLAVHRREVSIGGVRVYGHTTVHAFDDYADDFRADHAERYGSREGTSYADYDPAYRHGHAMASDARYGGRDWDAVEADARTDWEARHPASAWESVKDAVRHAWERVTR